MAGECYHLVQAGILNGETQAGIDYCNTCNLAECAYGSHRHPDIERRNDDIRRALQTSDIRAVAGMFGLSVRQVERINHGGIR